MTFIPDLSPENAFQVSVLQAIISLPLMHKQNKLVHLSPPIIFCLVAYEYKELGSSFPEWRPALKPFLKVLDRAEITSRAETH